MDAVGREHRYGESGSSLVIQGDADIPRLHHWRTA